jgi:hypothetical protein
MHMKANISIFYIFSFKFFLVVFQPESHKCIIIIKHRWVEVFFVSYNVSQLITLICTSEQVAQVVGLLIFPVFRIQDSPT